jgi:hypothetical protein
MNCVFWMILSFLMWIVGAFGVVDHETFSRDDDVVAGRRPA